MGQMISFARPDGQQAPGYFTEPKQAQNVPGVVLIEEWWGVTDHMKQTADRLASEGFRVLVPDLFRGRTAATGDEGNHLMEGLDFTDAATQDVRGAAQYLKAKGGKVGVMGFCIGGVLTMLGAMYVPEADAAVAFYGIPPDEAGDITQVRIPLQGHFAEHDAFFAIDRAKETEKKLRDAGKNVEFHYYDAKHGFCNPGEADNYGLGNYHREHAETAWKRAVAFFKRNLG
jgi:carboxymethylenebutenolidase